HGRGPPPVSTVYTARKESVSYAKALADCPAFVPNGEARPRRPRRWRACRRAGECGPFRVVHTQPLVSASAADVRPYAIQRCPELLPDWDRARGPAPAGPPWAHPAPPRIAGVAGGWRGARGRPRVSDGCPDGVSVAAVHGHGRAVCGGECHLRGGRDGGCLALLYSGR